MNALRSCEDVGSAASFQNVRSSSSSSRVETEVPAWTMPVGFNEQFGDSGAALTGDRGVDLGNGQWDIPALRELLENILPQNQVMDGYVVEHDFPGLGHRRMVLNARRIVTAAGNTELILLAMAAIEAPEKTS